MTVRDWVVRRSDGVPEALTARVVQFLGRDAGEPEGRAGEVCLAAATRSLDELLAGRRYARDSALDLLAVDALTTFAFAHASESDADPESLRALAVRGAQALSQIATAAAARG